jgi:hypothetical protein
MRLASPRTLLALAAVRHLDVIQFDLISAYLHVTLYVGHYIEQPGEYVVPGKGDWAWRLKKGHYGLAQACKTRKEGPNLHMVSEGLATLPKDLASTGRIHGTGRVSSPEESRWTNSLG